MQRTGPETVMPSEYYRAVFGGEMSDTCDFADLDEANEILGLMTRHWNTIAGTLFKGDVYVPLLLEDEHGMAHGNDWARGFMRGMGMRYDGWAELVNDEEHGGCLIPMMMLCHEHDEDPEMRPEPISPASLGRGTVLRGGFGLSYFPNEIGNAATLENVPFIFSRDSGGATSEEHTSE